MTALIAPSKKAGRFLLIFAWIIEICAASVGLLFAWLTLYSKTSGLETTNDPLTVILAAIPFLIVAIVELTKIPLASACYFSTSLLHKYAFGISLLLVSFITFETFANGFQLNLHLQLKDLSKLQKQKKQAEIELKALKDDEKNLTGLTLQQVESEASKQTIDLDKRKMREINFKKEQMDKERERLGGPKLDLLTNERDDLKKQKSTIAELYKSKLNENANQYKEQKFALEADTLETKKNLSARISSIETEIKNKSTKINQKESEIKSLRGRNFIGIKDEKVIRELYIKARANIDQSIQSEKSSLKERADDLTKQLDSAKQTRIDNVWPNSDLNDEITGLAKEIDNLSKKRMDLNLKTQNQELNQQESNAIAEARSNAKKDAGMRVEELQKEIEKIITEQKDLRRQKENIVRELSNTTIGNKRKEFLNQKTTLDQRLNKELTEEQTRLNELIQDKQAVLMSIVASQQIELFPMVEAHKREIENIDKKIEALKGEVEDNRKKRINDLNRRDFRMNEITNEAPFLVKKISDLEAEMVEEGEKTFVGQWTHRIYDDVEPEHVTTVAFVWFGSLAAITAWLGTLLAFASLVLRYNHEKEHKPSRVTRAIQRYFAVARKVKRKPEIIEIEKEVEKIIEVVKEVPVTKIEIQEVPKEVIRKHIVHVPIASDDLTILDFDEKLSSKSKEDRKTTDDKDNSESKT